MKFKVVSTYHGEPGVSIYLDTQDLEALKITERSADFMYKEHGFTCKPDDEGVQDVVDYLEEIIKERHGTVPF